MKINDNHKNKGAAQIKNILRTICALIIVFLSAVLLLLYESGVFVCQCC